ncbi:cytochrome P450 2U1-like isoform X2 [Paramacrobiotus metropolitanus]|nr:cytochrome P450 2U1-like isoform X2 [Paramacrobiotus metropolitanus]XP_055328100.1 cytochrome P450 2U1-like isoform X2 [Paramacrobiotus metropolitanus]XP_055328101.1 cytochrome P450 2U1-like isoform X2 [Paramacrobiotus metropolitanus]XP_055328102.1 cytochrome P450 2U1-like isoform X2 [Paramacrobiotus metropolitanus]XP_055328103.1 cytochrome P450 2U1-like isoform X2 [Paramacrobiotus metropolitanus]XP_055328104.1 cytochrome P450 2U1-like isoform X2 [Paramacrobiotus metropolitanus]
MGAQLVVVLNDAQIIREAFAQPVFNGRPDMYTARKTSNGYGISFAPDNTWQIHRKFAVKTFKMLGVGKNIMEEQIREEVERLITTISQFKGLPFCNKNIIRTAVGNVICAVLFGQRFTDNAETTTTTQHFYDQMNAVFRFFGVAGILNIFPWLIIVPKVRESFAKVIEALDCAGQYIKNVYARHLETYDSNVTRDYTDAFIASRLREKELYSAPRLFTDQQYVAAARELFLTGYDTTSATLRWAFLYTASDPVVQEKLHKEIDTVVGRSRLPLWTDVNQMPYTQAVLHEVQRISSIGPMGVPHRAIEATELGGYFIPKDAWIFTNLWHVHRDSNTWMDGNSFIPERFLSADGASIIIPKQFIPFSTGKRSCPGESLAKMELFLVFASVLQNFSLSLEGELDLEPLNGITLDTKDYQMRAEAR